MQSKGGIWLLGTTVGSPSVSFGFVLKSASFDSPSSDLSSANKSQSLVGGVEEIQLEASLKTPPDPVWQSRRVVRRLWSQVTSHIVNVTVGRFTGLKRVPPFSQCGDPAGRC